MDIVGVDEAGRGSLAGPVAVGLVRTDPSIDLLTLFPGLDDSKRLTPAKRERILDELDAQVAAGAGIAYVVIFRDAAAIDAHGIAVVIREAIAEGLEQLGEPGTCRVLLDGALRAPAEYAQETIIRGDASEPAIMLASVAAKVTRDRLLCALDAEHPGYGFATHKGYGTRAHYAALATLGLSEIHRATFTHID